MDSPGIPKDCIVHCVGSPYGARVFIEPLVAILNAKGVKAELWCESAAGDINDRIVVPKRFMESDIIASPFRLWRSLQRHRKELRTVGATIVHAHQTRNALIPLLAALLVGVKKRVYHNHGLPYLGYHQPMRFILRVLEKINIGLSTHVLFVSQSNQQEACDSGLVSSQKAQVLGAGSIAGIDLSQYAPDFFGPEKRSQARIKFGVEGAKFVLGYAGRPVRRKGFHFLLETWADNQFHEKNYALLAAGVGVSAEAVGFVVHPTPPGVQALGYVHEMKEFYAACDAIVLPSMHEGLGYALLECAAAGLPGIGSDIPGIRCVIDPGKTGLLVPFDDHQALAAAIIHLAENRELRQSLGRKARQLVEQRFDRCRVLDQLLGFYRKELGVQFVAIDGDSSPVVAPAATDPL